LCWCVADANTAPGIGTSISYTMGSFRSYHGNTHLARFNGWSKGSYVDSIDRLARHRDGHLFHV